MKDECDMKPEEYDVVRLIRDLPEHNLSAGSTGAVVMDYSKHSDEKLPPAYEVEFVDSEGVTEALVTVAEDDLEVVSRPGSGQTRSH
jgi:hypothetical protein